MAINKGTTELAGIRKGDSEVRCAFKGNTAIFVSNEPPSQHVISSSVSGTAASNADVIFTSIVTDDDLTGGTYQWTAGGVNVGTNSSQYTHSASNTTVAIQCTFTDAGGESLASNTINQAWAAPSLMDSLSGYSTSGLPDTFADHPGQTGGNQTGHSGTISFTNNSGQTITITFGSGGPWESVSFPSTMTVAPGASYSQSLSYGGSWGDITGQGRVSFSISASFNAPGFTGFGQTLLSGTAGQPGQ